MDESEYPIQVAARLSGLSAYVIRIWEQRYRAVQPRRTETKRRLYSQRDVERLTLLRDATKGGYSIGQIAALPNEKLRRLIATSAPFAGIARGKADRIATPDKFIEEGLAAVKALDLDALEEVFKHASMALGTLGLVQEVLGPMTQQLGDRWREGEHTAAHEHFASGAIRNLLANATKPYGSMKNAPALVVATPAGQVHEMGALLVGAIAANLGWKVTYLGASLPAAEIAGAAQQLHARAVALSVVYPEDDPEIAGELKRLRDMLPAEVHVIVGGRAVLSYRDTLRTMRALPVDSLADLGSVLDGLRGGKRLPGAKATRR